MSATIRDDSAGHRQIPPTGERRRVRIEPHPRHVPPAYPRGYERRLRLHDGREVIARPIVPADAAALQEAIRTADADTLRARFLGGPPPLTPGLLTHLLAVLLVSG